jgi:tetratricopeptide (TPR) repeat protein
MGSTEVGLDIDVDDATDDAPPWQAAVPPSRMPVGTLPPPPSETVDGLRSLARRHRLAEAWPELAQTLRRLLEVGQLQDAIDEQETIDLYAQLGELEGDVRGHVDLAIDAWREVIRIDGADRRALAALEDLFARDARWEDLVDVLEKRALVLDDEPGRRDTLLQAAAIWEEQLTDLARAAAIYERLWRADPADAIAGERLEAAYRQEGRWSDLVEVLLERSEAAPDAESQIEILHDIAAIYEHELGDQNSAFFVQQAAFDRDPTHEPTARELERLARATSQWQELRDALQRQADLEQTPEDKSAVYLRLAEATEHGGDLDGARRAYEQALVHAPASVEALDALVRLYRLAQAWQPLADTMTRLAELTIDEAVRARAWLEIAAIWESRVVDAGKAIAAYERVLELEPSSGVALGALEKLYESSQPDRYVEILETQLVSARSDADRVSIYERMAVAWEELGKLERAADAYEKVVAIDARNHAAYHLLARLYRQAGKPEALVDNYRNHLAAMPDVATQVELYVAIGQAYETELHDVDGAIQAYNDALRVEGRELRALDGLARLYDDVGAWDDAIDMLGRLVELDDVRKAQLYCRMGRIHASELGDAKRAEASWLRGLASDPGHMPTMDALTTHYEQHGDWLKAVDMMMRAESRLPLAPDKVRLSCAAANIYMRELRDEQRAKQLYAAVIALDPEHVDAGRPLAELYFAAGQWSELSPVIEMLCRKIGQRDPDPKEHGELLYRAARCADELGDVARALVHYKAAYNLDPTHLPTLVGCADLLFKTKDWTNAGKLYQAILVEQRALDEASRVQIYGRLGSIHQAHGDRKKALGMFVKALELDPRHRDALQAVIDLQTQQGDWQAVVLAKRGLVEAADEVGEKTRLLTEIGTHYHALQDPTKAAVAYVEALELAPENHQVLQKLLDLCIDSKQWKRALEVIERFAVLEKDPFHRGVYLHAAATLCRDELASLDEAVDYYARALDSFFTEPQRLDEPQLARALKSFEAIDKVLTTKRDWKAQERAYRDMIHRLPKGGDPRFYELQVGLIDGLAEIYRSRLKQYDDATTAFEIAQQMDPDNKLRNGNADRAEILAELYVMAGVDHADKAIDQHARMLRREPFNYDVYQALARIYKDTQQYDKYWCVCNALGFLRKGDSEQRQFVDRYKPRGFVKAKHVMSPASWGKLAHPDENRYISAVLGACSRSVAAFKGFPHKELDLKREDRRQLQGDTLMFSKLFVYLAQVLDVPVPDVYLVDDDKTVDIQLANALEKHEPCPSFVVRPHVLQGKPEREIAFLLTRRLAFMRPEYYLRMLLPTHTELKVVMLSAIVMLQPSFPVPPNMVAPIQQYVPEMRKRMSPQALEQLGALVERCVQASPEINLAKWGHAVDAVAHRAGFVMCGDLEVAARAIVAEPIAIDGPTRKDKVKELVLFSVSEEYFAIRAQMELTIAC